MHRRKHKKRKWTLKEFSQLWGILALISIVLCVVMLLFYFSGRGEEIVFKQGTNRSVRETTAGFRLYLYVAVFFGAICAVNLILLAATSLYSRFRKPDKATVVLKKRRK